MRRMTIRWVLATSLLTAGCGLFNRPEAVTAEFEGRDADLFAVNGEWIVYSWSPPNDTGRPIHLVIRNLSTGKETELEADWWGRGLDVDGSTLVYTRRSASGQGMELLAYDLNSGSTTTIAQAEAVSAPTVSGGTAAWETRDASGRRAIAIATTRGDDVRIVDASGRTENDSDSRPRLSGGHLVFLRQDLSTRSFALMHHDVNAGTTEALPVRLGSRVSLDVSGDWVVFSTPEQGGIQGLNLRSNAEAALASTPRRIEGPVVRGDFVAWVSHVSKEDFRPIAGQPLIDERDFRNLHVLDIGSGRVKTLTENRFMLRGIEIGLYGGVYAIVPRTVTASPDQISDIVRF